VAVVLGPGLPFVVEPVAGHLVTGSADTAVADEGAGRTHEVGEGEDGVGG
jgi:hypothetical protein